MKNTQEQIVREFLTDMGMVFSESVKQLESAEVPGINFVLELTSVHHYSPKDAKLLSDGLSDLLQTGALGDAKSRALLINQLRGATSAICTLERERSSLRASNIALSEEVLRLRSEVHVLRNSLTPSLHGNTPQEGN